MSLEKIQYNGYPALQDTDTGKIAQLPANHRLLETEFDIFGAIDSSGREIDLQFYELAPGAVISKTICWGTPLTNQRR